MMSMSKTLLLSTVALTVGSCFSYSAFASVQGFSNIRKSGIPAHTPITPQYHTREIPNLSSRIFDEISATGRQVVSVCFITDAGNCSGDRFGNNETPDKPDSPMDFTPPDKICEEAGYTKGLKRCSNGRTASPCPADPSYGFCPCDPSFSQVCESPYMGVGESCNGKYRQCQLDPKEMCKQENPEYTDSCPDGWRLGNMRCSYYYSYGICCNMCSEYTYTRGDIPDGYIKDEVPCIDCNNQKKYRIIPNPCEGYKDCDLTAPEIGAKTCLSGTVTKYDNCKACPNRGIYESCPTGYKCEYEKCTDKYYKVDGCQESYVWDAAARTCTCPNQGTLSSCPKGYKCQYEKCTGKYYKVDGCQSSYVWNAADKTCICPNKGTLTTCPTGYKCEKESCSGKYYKVDGCQPSYTWNYVNKTCTCPNYGDLSTCPTGYRCSYEACSDKYYKVDGCQESYEWNSSNKTCTCPQKGTFPSCPFGHKCEKEICSGKFIDYGCDTANGFVFNSSLNSCQCTSNPTPYGKANFYIYGVKSCTGYKVHSYYGCGYPLEACSNGRSAHIGRGKKCEALPNGKYWVIYETSDYFGCVDKNNNIIEGATGEFCAVAPHGEGETFNNLADCEAFLIDLPDVGISKVGSCDEPCDH